MEITIGKELIYASEVETPDDVALTLTEHRDIKQKEGKLNPFYCLEIKQGVFTTQLTFKSDQKAMAKVVFELIRQLNDGESIYLDKLPSEKPEDVDEKVHEVRGENEQ